MAKKIKYLSSLGNYRAKVRKRSLVKHTILIILLLGINFFGCSDNFDNTLVSSPFKFDEIAKILSENENLSDPTSEGDRQLTSNADSSDFNKIFVSKYIDGAIGGEIVLDTTYVNSEGRLINVYARLRFDPGVFDGLELIEMVPSAENIDVRLYPEMIFNDKVKFDYIITGLDLEVMGFSNNTNVNFVYFSPNGDIELVENDRCNVHVNQQRISVQGAKLNHFSRYGWIR